MIHVERTQLQGVLKITPDFFEDHRGKYLETYNEELYRSNGIDINFIQDDISVSLRHVLRGIHGDDQTWKLISCLEGKFYLVVVNNDPDSGQFRQWQAFTLSEENHVQILVPPRFGNGHLVLSQRAIFHYKQNTYYDPARQFTILWNDPEYNIWWPVKNPILSRRDEFGGFGE
jgi:dTDP-4-dehydrorhamnose 3,5-epimerase